MMSLWPLFWLCAWLPLNAADGLQQASLADQRGDFATALALYQTRPPTATPRPGWFYANLGHLHAKLDEWPQAILAYQEARRRDARLAETLLPHLIWARFQIDPERHERINVYRLHAVYAWLMQTGWLRGLGCVWVVLMAALLAWPGRRSERQKKWAVALLIPLGLMSLGLFIMEGWITPHRFGHADDPYIVVRVDGALLRQGNGFHYPAWHEAGQPIRVHEGQEGRLLAERPNGWLLVLMTDGKKGWLPRAAVWTLD